MSRYLKLSMTAALALAWGAALAAQGRPAPPLRLVHTTVLPGVRGRIDHLDVDLSGHRLFMSALGNDAVEVFDLRTLNRIHQLTGMAEPQGVTYASRAHRLFVANGGDGSVRVYDGSSYRLLKTVHLASDADDTRYDVARNRVWVGYGDEGSAGLGILDGTTGELVGTVPLPGHPESFQLEPGGPLIFVNIPTAGNIIAVVNRDQRRVVATWRLGEARENFPMALDAPGRRLYVTCRTPAQMLVLDTDTGKILDRLAVSGDADDMWYDAARRRIYISAGQGTIAVVRVDPSGGYSLEAEVPTAPGGRTSFFAPQLDRLFLGVWGRGGRPAELRAYAPMP